MSHEFKEGVSTLIKGVVILKAKKNQTESGRCNASLRERNAELGLNGQSLNVVCE